MFGGFSGSVGDADWAVLLLGFGYAAYLDWKTREAPDGVWLALGCAGFVLGLVALDGDGRLALGLWIAVGLLILQHFVPWDLALERLHESLPGVLEIVAYAVVGGLTVYFAWTDGIGDGAVPAAVVAAFATVVFARALFELGLLYGGADAKALIAAAALIPLAPPILLHVPAGAARLAGVVPGPFTLLMNAALLAVAVPIGIAVRNLRRGQFEGGESFVGYRIRVAELTERFVWLRDPLFGTPTEEEEAVETSADDLALRTRQRTRLEAQGVVEVWVTPQLPFLVFFVAGALVTAVAGNLLFDLLGLL